MSDSSRRAVSMRIGTSPFGESRRIARQTVTPSTPGQHHVEHDEIERFRPGEPQPFVAVAAPTVVKSLEPDVQHDEVADVLVVLDYQHAAPRLALRGIRTGSHP